ncbi:ADP-ribosylglycohydrolase family protein [Adhaeretor mobilis]|uniref:ADP-ribosyl-[dinitrogen reductase] glycohydrolase n=1 Tax=Adhaeretor mobilis TaxID=1930276 RepID=A0A517MWG8_9BACT|nr:ADP-ribosylglycohydrolase family protein [Adhaeretor mobilis]QDS99223.1 ADP-ribosyl-[dinitrogen reductase] glycohydrolase [Adhaeretor mobilis]
MNNTAVDQPSTIVTAGIVGQAVGDALGVPVEFQSRESLDRNPVIGMRSGGSHDQPAATWSDDSSLVFCLADSICETGVNYKDQAARFIGWLLRAEWTPHGDIFDVGNATREAILRLDAGVEPTQAGPTGEFSCGNGSLMRILPIALYLAYANRNERIEIAMNCSRLTHGHIRCQLACALFVEIAAGLARGGSIATSLAVAQATLQPLVDAQEEAEVLHFSRLLSPEIGDLDRSDISRSGYVIHCLESSLWCSLNAGSYSEGVLAAVNLGEDTDTTGAVAGALLSLIYGVDGIPNDWKESLARKKDVCELSHRFEIACRKRWELDK